MRIKISGHPEPELVIALRDRLRALDCVAVQIGADEVEATIPDAPSRAQEEREVRAYLATWAAARGVDAEVIDDAE